MFTADRQPTQQSRRNLGIFWELFGDFGRKLGQPNTIRRERIVADDGASLIQHRADVYLRTDSKATAMLTRMMGTSAQRLAEQSLGQLQMFYGGMGWYAYQDQERAKMKGK